MTERYDPSEDQIARVLEKTGSDPRKLAIAYLRAQKRARDAEAAFDIMDNLADATIDIFGGDLESAGRRIDRATRRVHQHKDISES